MNNSIGDAAFYECRVLIEADLSTASIKVIPFGCLETADPCKLRLYQTRWNAVESIHYFMSDIGYRPLDYLVINCQNSRRRNEYGPKKVHI